MGATTGPLSATACEAWVSGQQSRWATLGVKLVSPLMIVHYRVHGAIKPLSKAGRL